MEDRVIIVEYDPQWPTLFIQEAARIHNALKGVSITRIEHFGSTAVPELAAKPVIDILIGVSSLEKAKDIAVPILAALDYAYWAENPDPERLFFVKGLPPNGPRTHHIHMAEPDSVLWDRLLFRDYLRQHPEARERYVQLKHQLAAQYPTDREAYTAGKTAFVQSITERARQSNVKWM